MGWRRRSTSTETRRDETRPHPIYYIARRLLPSTGPRSPPSLYLSFSDKRAHTRRLHFFGFGLKTLTTWSFPSSLGPPMRSTQYGIAGNTASRHVPTAAGFPGRVTTRDLNRMPAGRRQKERERRGRSLLDLDQKVGLLWTHLRSASTGSRWAPPPAARPASFPRQSRA